MYYYPDITITATASTQEFVIRSEYIVDPVEFKLEEAVPTPWERTQAAYTPRCRPRNQFLAPRWLLRQQRPRDGLHG